MSKLRMTRNEYKDYMKKCVARIYNSNDTYSWDDYKKEDVEIIPLDLSAYPAIKKETEKWINTLFDEEDEDRNGNYMLRGCTRQEGTEVSVLNLSYGDYSDSINFWAYNDEEMLLYTFCEGDTTLTLFTNRETYEKEKTETEKWYEER